MTNSVASHGGAAFSPCASTSATPGPDTRAEDRASWANLRRNPGSSAYSGRITFTAAGTWSPATPRYTTPIPPPPTLRSTA